MSDEEINFDDWGDGHPSEVTVTSDGHPKKTRNSAKKKGIGSDGHRAQVTGTSDGHPESPLPVKRGRGRPPKRRPAVAADATMVAQMHDLLEYYNACYPKQVIKILIAEKWRTITHK
jgi:hypothetical protein